MLRVSLAAVAALLVSAAPALAQAPTLSSTERLPDKRAVALGLRAYLVGTQAGEFPAIGFHTRGEMGGIWSPPIKLLDGVWFGIDDAWIGPATRFESGYGFVRYTLPTRDGLAVTRTEQAWGAYGTVWPVVHQQLGISPDLGRARLEVVPLLPPGQPSVAGRDIRLGERGSVAVTAGVARGTYRSVVELDAPVRRLRLGHTLPAGARVGVVRLDGERTRYATHETHRGLEVTVAVGDPDGRHEVTITTER